MSTLATSNRRGNEVARRHSDVYWQVDPGQHTIMLAEQKLGTHCTFWGTRLPFT
jgi:hypothetical protein